MVPQTTFSIKQQTQSLSETQRNSFQTDFQDFALLLLTCISDHLHFFVVLIVMIWFKLKRLNRMHTYLTVGSRNWGHCNHLTYQQRKQPQLPMNYLYFILIGDISLNIIGFTYLRGQGSFKHHTTLSCNC